ncbi:MAG TPA: L-threonine 3-dehydrogenase [Firmicutes bacterium]|nr:L-threonine 3-dehydrogenase [Candidatus Fermentithermobacillaceae bacterium]
MKEVMKGILKKEPVKGAVLADNIPVPKVKDDEILVRVKATAICGTDLHIYEWTPWAETRVKLPMVFGHEFAGEIVEVGSRVRRFKVGQRVAGETHISCGHCYQCLTGNAHICENMKIIGVHVPGSFAEYIAIPESCAWPLDDNIDFEQGAFLEPMGVAMHGVQAGAVGGQNVLILGCGPIGLMGVGIARAYGANEIICSEPVAEKLKVAKTMGATVTLQPGKDDLLEGVMRATGGRGADVVIDFSGSARAIADGLRFLKKGGRMVLVGLPDKPVMLDLVDGIIYKEATLVGITGRTMYGTWYECEKVLKSGKLDLGPIVGGRFDLKDFDQAFEAICRGVPGKMLLLPEGIQ